MSNQLSTVEIDWQVWQVIESERQGFDDPPMQHFAAFSELTRPNYVRQVFPPPPKCIIKRRPALRAGTGKA